MHELAITQRVVEGVTEHVGDAKVTRVVLQIGRLSGVVPDAVRFCFDVCIEGTPLEGAMLDILEPPGRAKCHDCDEEIELSDLIPLCPCGSADVEILSGQELRIQEVEVL